MKKTKIVCTIGPASESKEILMDMIQEGMNVARLNFSHGNHEEQLARINEIKAAREELKTPVALLLDTKGPEIRTGNFADGEIFLEIGQIFTMTTRDVVGTNEICSVSYKDLAKDVEVGGTILIDDGLIELEIQEIIDETDMKCLVKNAGPVKNYKGVNVPGAKINLPALSEKDIADLKFGIENDVDFIAASFVRRVDDVLAVRKVLEDNGGEKIQIISKIENQEGVDNVSMIIEASDGVMVARGDLGVEIPAEQIPMIQKQIIKECNTHGKPVITATQMLDSMMRNPRPTRAEVTDVANAIYDGTDAIMLSGETAAGSYPIESVQTMSKIALTTEGSLDYNMILREKGLDKLETVTVTDSICHATCVSAHELKAAAILTATSSGYTGRMVAKFRPEAPIIVSTASKKVMRQACLSWGTYPMIIETKDSSEEIFDYSVQRALRAKFIKQGDLVVITAGIPVGIAGTTNMLKVHIVGEILMRGTGVSKGIAVGNICKVNNAAEAKEKFCIGDVLVAPQTDKDMVEYIEKACAVVTEEGGYTSHAAIVGLNMKKPTIVGVKNAMELAENGKLVTVDTERGIIYSGQTNVF